MFSGLLKKAGDAAKRAADTASSAAIATAAAARKASESASSVIANASLDKLQQAIEGDDISGYSAQQAKDPEFAALDYGYVAPRIIAMGPIAPKSLPAASRKSYTQLAASFLAKHHPEHFMVVNMSEGDYQYELFDNQVMEYKYPGHPAPPLGMLCKICTSIDSWLAADAKNVIVVHCMTGRGRTLTVLACYLAWSGRQPSAEEALRTVCKQRGVAIDKVIVASQRRYVNYFTTLMGGVKPRSSALVLRRVLMNGIPDLTSDDDQEERSGCRPVLQLFQSGKLLHSSVWSADAEKKPGLVSPSDGAVKFDVNQALRGDVLLRIRHKRIGGRKSAPMLRAAFHTGYSPNLVLRFDRHQVDNLAKPERYPEDFFVELVFAPVTVAGQGGALASAEGAISISEADRPAYDAMLEASSQLWNEIGRRQHARSLEGKTEDVPPPPAPKSPRLVPTFAIADEDEVVSPPAVPAVPTSTVDTAPAASSDRGADAGAGSGVGAGEAGDDDDDDDTDDEMAALEAELGLDFLGDGSGGSEAGPGETAATGTVDSGDGGDEADLDMDELEDYLNSLDAQE